MRERIAAAWQECCWALGIRARREPLDDLLARWSEPHRRYHDLSHLHACLALFDAQRGIAERPGEVQAALLFHDTVYDPTRSDNEARSAELARVALAGAPPESLDRIARAVEATRTHESDGSVDVSLVLDLDLAILGAEPDDYDAFERAIRAEYAHVPDAQFTHGRRAVLERLDAHTPLFRTPALHAALETRAHGNLARALRALDART